MGGERTVWTPCRATRYGGRTGESRIAHWVFLDANRWLLTGLLSLGAFIFRRSERTRAIDWEE